MQCDEKWAVVGKKDKPCDPADPADAQQGDNWDHVALDPEHRLVVSVVPGQRTADKVEKLVQDCKHRTAGRSRNLISSAAYPASKSAIRDAYGTAVVPPRTGKPGRPTAPYKVAPPEWHYATVHKTREKGRVLKVDCRVVFGPAVAGLAALAQALVSKAINPAFIERHNGTDRNRNARKVRKSYCFAKNWDVHEAVTYFTLYSYNFGWASADTASESRRRTMAAAYARHGRRLGKPYRLSDICRGGFHI